MARVVDKYLCSAQAKHEAVCIARKSVRCSYSLSKISLFISRISLMLITSFFALLIFAMPADASVQGLDREGKGVLLTNPGDGGTIPTIGGTFAFTTARMSPVFNKSLEVRFSVNPALDEYGLLENVPPLACGRAYADRVPGQDGVYSASLGGAGCSPWRSGSRLYVQVLHQVGSGGCDDKIFLSFYCGSSVVVLNVVGNSPDFNLVLDKKEVAITLSSKDCCQLIAAIGISVENLYGFNDHVSYYLRESQSSTDRKQNVLLGSVSAFLTTYYSTNNALINLTLLIPHSQIQTLHITAYSGSISKEIDIPIWINDPIDTVPSSTGKSTSVTAPPVSTSKTAPIPLVIQKKAKPLVFNFVSSIYKNGVAVSSIKLNGYSVKYEIKLVYEDEFMNIIKHRKSNVRKSSGANIYIFRDRFSSKPPRLCITAKDLSTSRTSFGCLNVS